MLLTGRVGKGACTLLVFGWSCRDARAFGSLNVMVRLCLVNSICTWGILVEILSLFKTEIQKFILSSLNLVDKKY